MEAWRSNNLVYIPITKNASITYRNLFKNLGWQEFQSDQINWDVDHVFAHLQDPYERHLKGITECLEKYNLFELVDNDNFLKLLGTAVFDLHSYPLAVAFGENFYKVDWILLDHPSYNPDDITKKFLAEHGIIVNDIPRLHQTTDVNKQNLLERIRKIRDGNKLTGTLTYFYEQDIVLYDKVNRNSQYHELENKSWKECSWLTNYNK